LTMTVGSSETLIATVRPDNATDKEVAWASTYLAVASVDNGTVTAHSRGTATIKVTTASGSYSAYCYVTVTDVPVTGVSLNKSSMSLKPGESEKLTATVTPSNATDKTLRWTTTNPYVAGVEDDGTVTAETLSGTATIKATASSGQYATCTVTVTIPVASVTLNKNALAFQIGDTEKLTATVQPSSATNKNVNWSSSNSGVATVTNDGQVTARGRGTATITAASQDGRASATCGVAVADTYVAGHRIINGKHVATLWTNGQGKGITDGSHEAVAESVYVSGSDVYVAGYEENASGNFVAKVWKNGSVHQSLNDGTYTAAAYSICVSNSNVYVAGVEFNDQGNSVATLWTNGKAKHLADGAYSSYAYSVTASGADVYVAGYSGNASRKEVAVVWKNGEPWVLGSNAVNSSATTVAVANGRVYVAGSELTDSNQQSAVLWMDGYYQKVNVNEYRARAHGLSVDGNDVYVSGEAQIYSDSTGTYGMVWKNGEGQRQRPALDLTQAGFARSVFVLAGNLFAAGTQKNIDGLDNAIMWVNGVGLNLAGSRSEARGIFVR